MNLSFLRFLRPWVICLSLLWPLVILLSCGPKAAPIVTTPSPVVTAFEQKMRWILQLEVRAGYAVAVAISRR
jgi:hypothetical protein